MNTNVVMYWSTSSYVSIQNNFVCHHANCHKNTKETSQAVALPIKILVRTSSFFQTIPYYVAQVVLFFQTGVTEKTATNESSCQNSAQSKIDHPCFSSISTKVGKKKKEGSRWVGTPSGIVSGKQKLIFILKTFLT